MRTKEEQSQRENLDALIKILLLEELEASKDFEIQPNIDYYCLNIISKNNIINSGILGLNFQKKESKLSATIKNSILRICENDESLAEKICPKFQVGANVSNEDFGLVTKFDNFSMFNSNLKLACSCMYVSLIEYCDLSFIELYHLKKYEFKNLFIATNFTPYGMKERKIISDRLKTIDIQSISFLLNKSQCKNLYSIPLSLAEKMKYRDFYKEHGDDTFHLDQLDYSFIKDECSKVKEYVKISKS